MDDIIQLKITLQWTKPPIWRRVLVDKRTTFVELHEIIQIVMGWEDYHLYEFNVKQRRIGDVNNEFDFSIDDELEDGSILTLGSVITNTKETFEYEYDFGDGWNHKILVEKFLPRDSSKKYPVCIDGKLNCPPEDCAGVGGFYRLLAILKDKKHPEHKEMLEWLGGSYDPEHFDKDQVNLELEEFSD